MKAFIMSCVETAKIKDIINLTCDGLHIEGWM